MKSELVRDKKYRASFGKMHTHTCWVTGQEFTEFSSFSVTGCHIREGHEGGMGMKPSDDLIIPLRQDLHIEMDKDQRAFLEKYVEVFPNRELFENLKDECDTVEIVKEMTRKYYSKWKTL